MTTEAERPDLAAERPELDAVLRDLATADRDVWAGLPAAEDGFGALTEDELDEWSREEREREEREAGERHDRELLRVLQEVLADVQHARKSIRKGLASVPRLGPRAALYREVIKHGLRSGLVRDPARCRECWWIERLAEVPSALATVRKRLDTHAVVKING